VSCHSTYEVTEVRGGDATSYGLRHDVVVVVLSMRVSCLWTRTQSGRVSASSRGAATFVSMAGAVWRCMLEAPASRAGRCSHAICHACQTSCHLLDDVGPRKDHTICVIRTSASLPDIGETAKAWSPASDVTFDLHRVLACANFRTRRASHDVRIVHLYAHG
jgi:hypothetical protein